MTSASKLPIPTAVSRPVAWALRLPLRDAGALAALRLAEGVEVGEHATAGEVWLRGKTGGEALVALLAALPATARYTWLPDGRLQPRGELLAVQRLPEVEWRPVREWQQCVLPVARLAAEPPPPVQLALVPGHAARPANAALVSLADFAAWVLAAPALRLAPLRFAATTHGRCLVLGAPLPALPCRACVEELGLVVPAGLTWRPAVSALVVRRTLHVTNDAVVLWDETGAQVLAAELFLPVSRGALRATLAGMASIPP